MERILVQYLLRNVWFVGRATAMIRQAIPIEGLILFGSERAWTLWESP